MAGIRFGFAGVWLKIMVAGIPILALTCWYSPVTNLYSRLGFIVFGAATLVELLWLMWRYRLLRYLLLTICVVSLVFACWSDTNVEVDQTALRAAYVNSLNSYIDKPYLWGGEGRFGIDCSGLVRRGMENALVWRGICTLNPELVRNSVSLWWHDNTARGIGLGYGGRTRLITQCSSLNELDYTGLQAGDMATNGTHIMAYLGNKQWIGADPGEGKVVRFLIPENGNFYFSVPMKIVRWTVLENKH